MRCLAAFGSFFGSSRVSLGTPKQRTVLAKLVMNPGRTVSTEELIDEIWPDEPPRSAVPNFRTYAANLRRAFESYEAGRGLLVRRRGGYCLEVPPRDVDPFSFVDHFERARQLNLRDQADVARSLLNKAMLCWLGPPLLGVPLRPSLSAHVANAQEQYLLAVELLATLHLGAGDVDQPFRCCGGRWLSTRFVNQRWSC